MAFIPFGNAEPTQIKYNNSDVKAVLYKEGANSTGTYVWGKHFSITFNVSYGTGATQYAPQLTLYRTASQYENATLYPSGTTPDKTVYYGDEIRFDFNTLYFYSGNEIDTISITNGGTSVPTTIPADRTSAETQSFNVAGNIVVNVVLKQGRVWTTVWSGIEAFNTGNTSSTTLGFALNVNDVPADSIFRFTGYSIGGSGYENKQFTFLSTDTFPYIVEIYPTDNTNDNYIEGGIEIFFTDTYTRASNQQTYVRLNLRPYNRYYRLTKWEMLS